MLIRTDCEPANMQHVRACPIVERCPPTRMRPHQRLMAHGRQMAATDHLPLGKTSKTARDGGGGRGSSHAISGRKSAGFEGKKGLWALDNATRAARNRCRCAAGMSWPRGTVSMSEERRGELAEG